MNRLPFKTIIPSYLAAVSCPMLSNPENGVVDVTDRTLGNTATYTCDTGHVLEGESSRTCMPNAMWSDDEPVCIGRSSFGSCDYHMTRVLSSVTTISTHYGMYVCD